MRKEQKQFSEVVFFMKERTYDNFASIIAQGLTVIEVQPTFKRSWKNYRKR